MPGDEWTEGSEEGQVLVPVSAIEHYSYCPRQCALIHVEQTFDENLYTLRGRLAHERVDIPGDALASGVRIARGLPLWSDRLGLVGKADLVEFRTEGPYPVEFKVGRRHGPHAEAQLCAQALCLEEMIGAPVHRGAVYYHAEHRRREVQFGEKLRRRVEEIVAAVRVMLDRHDVPGAVASPRCRLCSLKDSCLPEVISNRPRLRGLQGSLMTPFDIKDEPHA